MSIVLSSRHLAGIPFIIGVIAEQGRVSAKRALVISALFSTGILFTAGSVVLKTLCGGLVPLGVSAWCG